MQKNGILAKNRRYAKMRENENLRTLAKIEWTPVQSLLLLGYCNFTKNCSTKFFIRIQKDFLILLLWKNYSRFEIPKKAPKQWILEILINFLGIKKFFRSKKFFQYIPHNN